MKTRMEKREDVKVEICEHCNAEYYPFEDGSQSGDSHKCKVCGKEGCDKCMNVIRIYGVTPTHDIWFHRVCQEKFFDMALSDVIEGEME